MAVPTGHIRRVMTRHAFGLYDHVFQDFVEPCTKMNRACRIGRTVVQNKQRLALAGFKNALVKMRFLPSGKLFRLILRETRLHRKIGLRQVQCLLEFQRFGHGYVRPQINSLDSEAVPRFRYSTRNFRKRCNSVCYNDWEAVSAAGVAQPFPARLNHIDLGHPSQEICV